MNQKMDRFQIRKVLINLLQSNKISGYLLDNFTSNTSINCTRKSLHSRIISLDFDRSDKISDIFLIKYSSEFLYWFLTAFINFLIIYNNYSSVTDNYSFDCYLNFYIY